ncbi:MAG: PAS domain S-box protein [Halanaeroarchaeum sp.]
MRTGTDIRVLHVDDDPDFAELAADMLEREDDRFSVQTAERPSEGLDRLRDAEFDCVVSDYDMPGQNGIAFLEAVRDEFPELPFILYTGKGSEEIASEAISAGVTDYLQKETGTDQYTVLANRITNVVESHQSRRRLAERNRDLQRYKYMINSMYQAACVYDDAGRFAIVNDFLADWYDTTREALEGQESNLIPLIREQSDDGDPYQALLDGEREQLSGEIEGEFPGHGYAVLEYRLTPLTIDGEVEGVVGVTRDVTEHTARERELRRYEAYLEESSDIVTVLDEEGTITYQSPAVERILGYDRGEFTGEVGFEYIHPDDVDEVTDAFTYLLAHPEETVTVEARFKTADGEWLWLEIRGTNRLEHDAINGIVTNNRDISARKRHRRELERTNTVLSTLFETLPVGVLAEDADRNVLAVNERLFELFELSVSPEAAIGADCERLARDVSDSFVEPSQFVERINEVVGEGESVRNESLSLADGRTFARDYEPLELPGGEGHLWVYRDITNRTNREEALKRERDRLDEFAGVVSHDLRNPLNVAEGRLELAREDCESEHFDAIETALGRIDDITGDVLWLAREGRDIGSKDAVLIRETIDAAWEIAADREGSAEVRFADDDLTSATIEADEDRLRQLLENLFRNAIEHGGPAVTVTVGAMEDGFYVEDDGPGIPDERRDEVFAAGYSTGVSGTGFGLRIVEQIAEAHGWDIAVTEGSDGGARFEITGVEYVPE